METSQSPRAAEKIRQLLGETSQENGLRLKVVAGGCSGFEYKMAIDARAAEDWVLEKNGARIFLDANSAVHLIGTELDYKDDLMQSGFTFSENAQKKVGPEVGTVQSTCSQMRPIRKTGRVMKNEKTRFGENGEFDEKANEDKYFTLKEHERIDEMKVDFQNAEAARREGQVGSCPTCAVKLEKYGFMGFVLQRCESCQGIWLKPAELRGIVRKAARGPLGAFFDRCFPRLNRNE